MSAPVLDHLGRACQVAIARERFADDVAQAQGIDPRELSRRIGRGLNDAIDRRETEIYGLQVVIAALAQGADGEGVEALLAMQRSFAVQSSDRISELAGQVLALIAGAGSARPPFAIVEQDGVPVVHFVDRAALRTGMAAEAVRRAQRLLDAPAVAGVERAAAIVRASVALLDSADDDAGLAPLVSAVLERDDWRFGQGGAAGGGVPLTPEQAS